MHFMCTYLDQTCQIRSLASLCWEDIYLHCFTLVPTRDICGPRCYNYKYCILFRMLPVFGKCVFAIYLCFSFCDVIVRICSFSVTNSGKSTTKNWVSIRKKTAKSTVTMTSQRLKLKHPVRNILFWAHHAAIKFFLHE